MISEALGEMAKVAAVQRAPPFEEPAQLELPLHLHAGGPTGPQVSLFGASKRWI